MTTTTSKNDGGTPHGIALDVQKINGNRDESPLVPSPPAVLIDNGGGTPSTMAINVEKVDEDKLQKIAEKLQKEKEERLQKEFNKRLDEMRRSANIFTVPKWLQSTINSATILVGAILLLFVVAQISSIFADIATMPLIGQWLVGLLGIAFGVTVIVIAIKIGLMLYRFNKSPAINMLTLKVLNERIEWQNMSIEAHNKAKTALKKYLKNFSLNEDTKRHFIVFGMTSEDFDKLIETHNKLCDNSYTGGNDKWIKQFQDDFQTKLDNLAKRCINAYYYKVLTGTALSPNPTVDQIIVITACLSIIHDLLQIYQVTPATGQSLVILSRAITLSYIGGNIQDWAKTTTDTAGTVLKTGIDKITADLTKIFGTKIVDALPIIGSITAPVTAKIAEGTLNAILIQRLGKNIITQLQPTQRQ
jgi:uncharacterized membrane protein YcjF (UPF0283 family)